MLFRSIILLLMLGIASCRSGIIPCPENKGFKLKSSRASRNVRVPERRQAPEAVSTVADDAKILQPTGKARKYRYVRYTIQHVDVDEMDCPKPGDKKANSRALKENARKNRKKIKMYYEDLAADTLQLIPAAQPGR